MSGFVDPQGGLCARSQYATISLDNGAGQGGLYTCGDLVRGRVRMQMPLETNEITIHFKCKAKTHIRVSNGQNSRTFKGKAYLYWFRKTLLAKSPHSVSTGNQEYSFEFRFPYAVQPAPSAQSMEWAPMTNYESEPGHVLPPTFEHNGEYGQSISHYVELVIATPSAVFSSDKKLQLPLRFTPSRTILNPDPDLKLARRYFSRQSHLLDPNRREEGAYGFRQKLKVQFGRDDPNPTASFTVEANMPSVLYVDGPIPLTLSLYPETKTSTAPQMPEVYLLSAHVRVAAYVDYRAPRAGLISNSWLERQRDEKIILFQGATRRLPMYENMDMSELLPRMKCSVRYPTFRTYCINHWYILKVSVVVECAGKTFDLELGKCDVMIFPSEYRPPPNTPIPVDAEQLPQYMPPPSNAVSRNNDTYLVSEPHADSPPMYSKVDPAVKNPNQYASVHQVNSNESCAGNGNNEHGEYTSNSNVATSQSLPQDGTSNISSHTTFSFVNIDPNAPSQLHTPTSQPSNFPWAAPEGKATQPQPIHRQTTKHGPRRHTLQPLQIPSWRSPEYNRGPMTASVYSPFSNEYEQAIETSPIDGSYQNPDVIMPIYGSHPGPMRSVHGVGHDFFPDHNVGSWPPEGHSSSLGSNHSSRDFGVKENFYADPDVANSLDHLLGEPSMLSAPPTLHIHPPIKEEPEDVEEIHRDMDTKGDDADTGLLLELSPAIPAISIGSTPGLRYLINYYDKVIAPVIVAFDGPTNPYRTHILRLAHDSLPLQHAIAALSASNLRMRREHNPFSSTGPRRSLTNTPHDQTVRKSSMAHSLLNDDLTQADTMTKPGQPTDRELKHKIKSIDLLNDQLRDPSKSLDDTTLATLLVLCLYHICDTGVAKFKTQFAGVKQILGLRNGMNSNSKEAKWLVTMFKWFDAMTATVNDREGQFHDLNCLEIDSDEEWALENLAGCDGRLFNTIAKLGRLNLLSQGKSVAPPSPLPTPKVNMPARSRDYYAMNRFDGNGYATILPDEDLQNINSDYNTFSFERFPDQRTQFWREWANIREALSTWSLDATTLPSPMLDASATSAYNAKDLSHISEAFRFSALIYTERLAFPTLHSASDNFQSLVQSSLAHIAQVKSDVYLLWPLFITGTECVYEEQRSLIRERCLMIQKDSGFFNNISGLEILERIWREEGEGPPQTGMSGAGIGGAMAMGMDAGVGVDLDGASGMLGAGGSMMLSRTPGFKWRKAMETVDEEYIVI